MAYNAAKPQPTDYLDVSQNDILQNFSQANTTMAIDHYAFTDATGDNGKHKQVTLPATTAPTVTGDDLAVYNKLVSTVPQLFVRNATTEYQISGTSTTTGSTYGSAGECALFNGLNLKWGKFTCLASGTTLNYVAQGLTSFPTNTLCVVLTCGNSTTTGNYATISGTPDKDGFVAYTHSLAGAVNFIAIGI